MKSFAQFLLISLIVFLAPSLCLAQQQGATPAPAAANPAVDEWGDDFNGKELDTAKWEVFSLEGGSGGRLKVEEGQLRMRGAAGARAGVRSTKTFNSDHFVINAVLAKVGEALPEAGRTGPQLGNAIVTIMFDGRNRIEWILTSEGMFEAWAIVDGRGERLDGRNLATKAPTPTLSVARRGDEFLFALNGQVGLQKTVKGLPKNFRVMLYGFGSSENNWDSVQVLVTKKP